MKNFFEHQEEARQSTAKLVALYGLAVVLIVAMLYVAMLWLVGYGVGSLWHPGLLLAVAAGALLTIGGGSAFKTLQLRGGGSTVAEQLGGRPLDRSAGGSVEERRLLNVVEEMAIASGVPVPSVYVLDEEGINAFAAGHTIDDAVIGVTRGCVERLDRPELQGVIAHEFSHILNGDMRINLRLIGILHGILLIGLIGRMLVYSGRGRSRRKGNRLALVGLAFFVIGSAGVLCGRMIQSAISRQREFLADASAVQFTRNPDGIAGALKKIGGYSEGSRVEHPDAQEASHLFFSYALSGRFLSSLFSTHPPLDKRIQRLEPGFDGTFPQGEGPAAGAPAGVSGLHGSPGRETRPRRAEADTPQIQADADRVAEQAGMLDPEHLRHGAHVLEGLPSDLRQGAHEPLGAVAIVYGLLLDPDEAMRARQEEVLQSHAEAPVYEETRRLYSHLRALEGQARLPLLDLAAPALRALSKQQYATLLVNIQRLAEADDQLTIFEYALRTIVRRRLKRVFEEEPPRARYRSFRQVQDACEALLAALAHVGHQSDEAVRRAFRAGLVRFSEVNATDASFREPTSVSSQTLDRALRQLERARPALQRQLVDACAHCVLHDREVTIQEAELLRAVAIALGCPLPPFLPRVADAARES